VLLVNLVAALSFADVFKNKKNVRKILKNVKTYQNKKIKNVFTSDFYSILPSVCLHCIDTAGWASGRASGLKKI